MALYATLISAASYRAAFLGATVLAVLGVVAAAQASPRAARSAG